jgi:hypothetical protein
MKKLLLTAGIAALSVLASAAQAGQRVVVDKPRTVARIIQGSLMPPPQYDKPYDGELEIRLFSTPADLEGACKDINTKAACTYPSLDHKRCIIHMGTEELIKRKGGSYAFSLRHELAHCNGWKHPNSLEGEHFKIGQKWDKAEGAKWIAADTRMPMPTLPKLTRILPASPVVCVTPDWQKEPCESRKAAAVEAETDRRIKQSPNTKTYEGLWRWCREHPNTVATECKEL